MQLIDCYLGQSQGSKNNILLCIALFSEVMSLCELFGRHHSSAIAPAQDQFVSPSLIILTPACLFHSDSVQAARNLLFAAENNIGHQFEGFTYN